jgi:hypothetical protein
VAIFVQSNFASGQGPAYGFPGAGDNITNNDGFFFNVTELATGGPDGGPCLQFDHIADTDQTPAQGGTLQYNFGWGVNGIAAASAGAARYVRFKIRIATGFNMLAWHPVNVGEEDTWQAKYWELGPGGTDSNSRILGHLGDTDAQHPTNGNVLVGCQVGIESNEIRRGLVAGSWHAVQVRIQSSTPVDAVNGHIAQWIDNDTVGSPNDQTINQIINTEHWDEFTFQLITHTVLKSPGGALSYRIYDVQLGDTFDASYFTNMGSGGSSSSSRRVFGVRS